MQILQLIITMCVIMDMYILWYLIFIHTYNITSYIDMRVIALILSDLYVSKLKVTWKYYM